MAQAGELRQRVSFYRPKDADETTQNSIGEDIPNPVLLGTFWAKVSPVQGTEVNKADQKWGETFYSIEVRPQPGINFNSKMTANWNGIQMDIQNIAAITQDSKPIFRMIMRNFIG